MNSAADWARARAQTRLYASILVGAGLAGSAFAAFTGASATDTKALTMAFVSVLLACGMPVSCFVMANAVRKGGIGRKPNKPYALLVQAVYPLLGVIPAAVIAMVMHYQWAGVTALAATLVVGALLWPTENRLDLIMSGEARIYFPMVAA